MKKSENSILFLLDHNGSGRALEAKGICPCSAPPPAAGTAESPGFIITENHILKKKSHLQYPGRRYRPINHSLLEANEESPNKYERRSKMTKPHTA